MPMPASVLTQGENPVVSDKKNLTRTITAHLSSAPLRRGLLSSRDKEFLSVLYYASDNGICQLSHQEIADRMGGCGTQAITKRLQRLERFKHLLREGNHRNQKIHLSQIPDSDDQKLSLTIPEEIWTNKKLSPSQKHLVTVILAFPKVKSKNWTWWPDRIGMDHQSYKLNLRKIILKFDPEPYKTLYGNPIRLYKEPYKTLEAFFGIGGQDSGIDNNLSGYKGASPQMENSINPSMEDEKKMHPTPIQENPKPFDYNRYKEKSVGPPKAPKKHPPIKEDILMELQNEVFQHRYITPNKSGDALAGAAEVVTALKHKNGLSSMLDGPKIELIIQTMSTGINKFHPDDIRKVLHRQFSDEERVDLYERLSNSRSEAYDHHGKGKKINLGDTVWTYGSKGYCRLIQIWLSPPKLLKPAQITITVPKELELPLAIVKRFIPDAIQGPAVKLLKEAQGHYDKNILPFQKQMNMTVGFAPWVRGFLEFAYNKATRDNPLHPGWLKPTAPTYQEWETSYKAEARWEQNQRDLGASARADSDRRNLQKEIENYMDQYGEAETWEAVQRNGWPEDLVRAAVHSLQFGAY